jgi:hypothetical protein
MLRAVLHAVCVHYHSVTRGVLDWSARVDMQGEGESSQWRTVH